MKFYVSEFFDNKSVKKYQLSLKSDKNSGHLARRPMGIYASTSLTVLRRIFVPRRDEVTGEWRRLYNEELNDLYGSPNIVRVKKRRRMRWAGHVARMGEERGVYRVLVGKQEGRRPLGRPRRR
jgi:hypothetical protein